MEATPQDSEQRSEPGKIHKRVSQELEGFSPIFEGAVALAAVVGLFLLGFQIYYMREGNRLVAESLRLTRESNEETRLASDDALRTNARILSMMAEQNRLAAEATAEGSEQAEADRIESEARAAVEQGLTRQTIADSRRAFEVAHRARLAVEDTSHNTLQAGEPLAAWVLIRNTGEVPATNVQSTFRLEMRHYPLPDDAVEIDPGATFRPLGIPIEEGKMDVGAGLSYRFEVTLPTLHAENIEKIKGERQYLYFVGHVTYDDGFGQRRKLIFCAEYLEEKPRETPWMLCPRNNRAD